MVPVEGGLSDSNFEERNRPIQEDILPFLSSIVTVSLAHFMRNLGEGQRCCEVRALEFELSLVISVEEQATMLT